MTALKFLLYLIALCVLSAPAISDEIRPTNRMAFYGSTSLPDHLAYRAFLMDISYQYSKSQTDAEMYVSYLMNLPDTPEGEATSQVLVGIFVDTYGAIENEIRESQLSTFCVGKEAVGWSKDEYFDVMDTQDELNDVIIEKHFQQTVKLLDSETNSKFQAALADMKTRTVMTRTNHKASWEAADPEKDPAEIFSNICESLRIQHQNESHLNFNGEAQ